MTDASGDDLRTSHSAANCANFIPLSLRPAETDMMCFNVKRGAGQVPVRLLSND